MIPDAQHLFSDAQALSATAASTNIIDLGVERRIGSGEPMVVVITVDVALAGTTPTFVATLQSDDNSGFASAATVAATPSYSALAVGRRLYLSVPPDLNTERYLRLNYTLGGTTPTVTVTSFLQPASMINTDYQYPDALTIS